MKKTSESKRVLSHLSRSRRTVHAVGGVGMITVQVAEMLNILIFKRQSETAAKLMWICMTPYALGLLTPHLQRRMNHIDRKLPSLTGMLWVASFNALACSMNEVETFYTNLFKVLLICSLVSTILEVGSGVTRGNGWIFGVVFTYLTLFFPLALDFYFSEEPLSLKEIYETQNIGMVLYYNCIHNSFFVSLSFFLLSMRDSKIISEEFADKVGSLLWTVPQIPLCYAAIWRLSCLRYANIWLVTTGSLAGIIIYLQKKRGWFMSTLKVRVHEA
jgi:hypothetical protein